MLCRHYGGAASPGHSYFDRREGKYQTFRLSGGGRERAQRIYNRGTDRS